MKHSIQQCKDEYKGNTGKRPDNNLQDQKTNQKDVKLYSEQHGRWIRDHTSGEREETTGEKEFDKGKCLDIPPDVSSPVYRQENKKQIKILIVETNNRQPLAALDTHTNLFNFSFFSWG